MPRLNEFRSMIDDCNDPKVLESALELLRDIMSIRDMQRKIDELNAGLTDGGKAIFYFFAEELDEDEIVFAAERVSGKIKRVKTNEE